MSKFKLKHKFGASGEPLNSETTKTFEAETLTEVLFQFTDFLRGVGYVFDGEVGIVEESSSEEISDEQFLLDFENYLLK